jgi:transcriptional regulator with XRE-family HTH domain
MKTLKERTDFAVASGFTVGKLAKAAGKSSSAVSQWRSGETRELKGESAIGLAKLTGWTAEWWISGKEPRIANTTDSTVHAYSDTTLAGAPAVEWARLGEDVLKDPSELGGAEVLGYTQIGAPGRRAKLVPVVDDSLAPRLIVGDMVAIDPDNKSPKRGQVTLFRSTVDGEFFLRRFQPLAHPDFEAVDAKGVAMDSKRHGLEIVGVNCGMRPSDL